MEILDQRDARFKNVIRNRQLDIAVVLEKVHDPHNIGAVLRTCDAVGIHDIYVINSEAIRDEEGRFLGKGSSTGADKWLRIHHFTDVDECLQVVSQKYVNICATHLAKDSVSLYDLDFKGSGALLFGNEHVGLSNEILKYATHNFIIPQFGMVQSLNISVACAISLYEVLRQRILAGKYDLPFEGSSQSHSEIYLDFIQRHYEKRILAAKARINEL